MAIKRWRATERRVCKLLGMEHVGGPGQPDCSSGADIAEVKDQRRLVSKSQMQAIIDKPWAEDLPLIVVSTSGFTQGAAKLDDEYEDVWLYEMS